ncbi:GHKL domain-containing protein [candidate division WOR-3 bacterium]|uniref:histidine kinase n=1 Tax=candidate division WOR-3 bacterium TaxID=2052148 RepID=A0A9D5QDF9_UNCW3|nr:GHKL domain-containing protein [candidate division WOR-3 bacterium]MBD3365594.1 GHKL domain-containing protein [candidate division WOR-3 bacterium]
MDETLSKKEMSVQELRDYTEERLADILSVLSDVALGDLTVEAVVESEDIFGSVAMGVNAMIKGLRELKEQDKEKSMLLEKSNQELEDFVYIVSHDLKAPLRAIIGFAEFLKEDYADRLDKQGQDYVRRMVESAERMQQLINDLLELSRIGRYKNPYVEINAGELALKAVEFINPPDDVKIDIADDMPDIFCDEVRMQQVLANLITNAMKYNDKEKKKIEIAWIPNEDEDLDEFTISDNGIGIEAKHLERIFKIFQRLHTRDEYGGGTGVGLNIVKKIIEQHGGTIWVESEVGKGTCFHFTLCRGEEDEV